MESQRFPPTVWWRRNLAQSLWRITSHNRNGRHPQIPHTRMRWLTADRFVPDATSVAVAAAAGL